MMRRSAAVFGPTGMVGADLVALLGASQVSLNLVDRSMSPLELGVDSLARLVDTDPVVYNCMAYTKVDEAEYNEREATEVNGLFVARLAAACKKTGARMCHISTDYVFDGKSSKPYDTFDNPKPQSAYGRSKLVGEQALQASEGDFVIFRTSWLYGSNGSSFPKTIARRLAMGEPVRVVADQIGSPTWTKDLVQLLVGYASLPEAPKIVHATSSGSSSWFEFAQTIALTMGLDPTEVVIPTSSVDSQQVATRPSYSVLNNSEGPLSPIGHWKDRWLEASTEVLGAIN